MKKSVSILIALLSIVSSVKIEAQHGVNIGNSNLSTNRNIQFNKGLKRLYDGRKLKSNDRLYPLRRRKIANDISRAKEVVKNNPGGEWKVRKVNGKKIVYYSVGGITLISVPFIVYLVIKLAKKPEGIDISASTEKYKEHYDKISKEFFSLINENGVMDFLKDYNSMVAFINSELPKVTEILKKQPALTTLDAKADVMIIGDVHGTTEVLKYLIPKTWEFLNKNNKNSIVILGDFIDRHVGDRDDGIYVASWFFRLARKYPNRLRILRGNHEDIKYGCNSSLHPYLCPWWCKNLEDCMSELPIACVISHNGKKYFAVHGGIDDRLEISKDGKSSNLKKRHILKEESLTNEKTIKESLTSRLMWNVFWDPLVEVTKNNDRRHKCTEEETSKFLTKHGFSAIFRGHNPFEKPILCAGNVGHVVTVHSNSVVGPKARPALNARVAYIKNDGIKLDYFFDNKIVDVNENIDWNNFK